MSLSPIPLDMTDEAAGVIAAALKLEGFFPEFKVEHAQKVFPRSGYFLYPRECQVIFQGDAGRDVYILHEGRISITKTFGDAGAELALLGPGDIFGEIALVQDGPRTATAFVEADSKIFRLVYDDILYLLKNNPALADHLKQLAYNRLAQQ